MKNENVFISLLFNILLPVLILNRLTTSFETNGPLIALLIALAFPVMYFAWDFSRRRKSNMVSLIGIINVLATGGLALLGLSGISFAIKEAAFPLLMGLGVFASSYSKRPFMSALFLNEQVVNVPLLHERLAERKAESEFQRQLRLSTQLLAGSFLLSAVLNFVLGYFVFPEMAPTLTDIERSTLLNEQIARMTWMSMLVIMIPSMLCLAAIIWHLIRGISKMTGLHMNEIFNS